MADVVMTDIPAPVKKAVGKAKAGGSEGGTDGKKRFEVKKVTADQHLHTRKSHMC
jgi:RING-box protein 1